MIDGAISIWANNNNVSESYHLSEKIFLAQESQMLEISLKIIFLHKVY